MSNASITIKDIGWMGPTKQKNPWQVQRELLVDMIKPIKKEKKSVVSLYYPHPSNGSVNEIVAITWV